MGIGAMRRIKTEKKKPRAGRAAAAAGKQDSGSLIHDLQVHQIELEMQNDELRRTQHELEAARDRLSDLYDFSPVGYVSTDLRGIISEMNLTMASMLRHPRERLLKKLLAGFVSPSDRARFLSYKKQLRGMDAGLGIEVKLVRRDGTEFNARVDGVCVESRDGAAAQCRFSITDITVEHNAREIIREYDELRQFAENVDEVVMLSDAAQRELVFISPSVKNIFGREPDTMQRRPSSWIRAIHPEDRKRVIGAIRKSKEGGFDEEFRIRRPDGEVRWIWGRNFPIRDAEGNIVRIAGVARDITRRKEMEDRLITVQKLESVGVFAGGIAHDLNNLLTIIIGNIAHSMNRIDPHGATYKNLSKAENACELAKDLSYRLLTFAKGGEPLVKTVSVAAFLEDSVRFALSGSNVKEETSIADGLLPVNVDEGQIKQVLYNLVLNAKEAMPGGGVLKVRAGNAELSENEIPSLKEGPYVRISVEDHGLGIPERNLTKIFDPYFTTKGMGTRKGTGLGLSICHSIVKKHGGSITVESVEGKGAVFHVYLPAAGDAPEALTPAAEKRNPAGAAANKKPRILFMDDEELIRDLAKEMISQLGFEVEVAGDGGKALALYREAGNNGAPFDLVIIDLTIPGGMGGQETMRRLREIDPGVRAVVTSGYTDNPVIRNFREYGFIAALPKPYRIEDVNQLLRNIVVKSS
jgi:PAS domain S-box-containing protein